MKKFSVIFILLAVFFACLFLACDTTDYDLIDMLKDKQTHGSGNGQNRQEEQTPAVPTDIKYLRCSDYLETSFTPDMYPPRFIFTSAAEFEDCIAPLVESQYAYVYYQDGAREFQLAPAVEDYHDAFFKDRNLVMIMLKEGSGSIGHKVETVDIKNDELNIKIKRTVPGEGEEGTCDMAYWYIFIPIKKDYFDGDIVNVEIVSTPNDQVKEPPVVPPIPYTYTGAGYAFNTTFTGFLSDFPWDKYLPDYRTETVLVSSKTEIRELFGETYNFRYENGVVRDTYFQDIISKYNDDYFENHQLLTFFLGTRSGGDRHELESVVYKGGVLTVTVDYLDYDGPSTTACEWWFAIVEIYRIPADTKIDIIVNDNGKLVPTDADSRFISPHCYMLTGENPPVMVPPVKTEIDLLEKYGLSMGVFISNDYMPSVVYPLRSIFTIQFDSPVELPPMEVFATVITDRITMQVPLYEIYGGKGAYGKLFRKDFRPVGHFRLNDGEDYTVEITVKIHGEQQTITTEKQKVGVTW